MLPVASSPEIELSGLIDSSLSLLNTFSKSANYIISVTATDYPTAEDILKKATEIAIDYVEKEKGEASFKRNK